MASNGNLEVEVEIKAHADKFWETMRDSNTIFPKAFPDLYKSIEVLEGDGKSVGSIRLVTFAQGIVTYTKEKIEEVDEANKMVAYSILDGDLQKYYKNFKASLKVSLKEGAGSLVKWSCVFEKASDEIPDLNLIKDFAVKNFLDVDAYLLKSA